MNDQEAMVFMFSELQRRKAEFLNEYKETDGDDPDRESEFETLLKTEIWTKDDEFDMEGQHVKVFYPDISGSLECLSYIEVVEGEEDKYIFWEIS